MRTRQHTVHIVVRITCLHFPTNRSWDDTRPARSALVTKHRYIASEHSHTQRDNVNTSHVMFAKYAIACGFGECDWD